MAMDSKIEIVAEIGANHHQKYEYAKNLIIAAKDCGADTVKVQMFEPDKMVPDSEADHFLAGEPWNVPLYKLYQMAAMPLEWIPRLQAVAKEVDIELFASIYYPEMVVLAEQYGIPRYKIASFEINYIDLIKKVSATGKPVIISTGAAKFDDIKKAVAICDNLTLLKCVSSYPAPIENMNLRTIPAMKEEFGVPVGLSDHTTGIVAPVVATSLGVVMIEKHLSLDCEGLDGSFSVLPDRFRTMVSVVRAAEKSLGKVKYQEDLKYRRALVALTDIAKGQKLAGKVYPYRTVPEGKMETHKYAGRNYLKGEMI